MPAFYRQACGFLESERLPNVKTGKRLYLSLSMPIKYRIIIHGK